jgi:hypothetical protein
MLQRSIMRMVTHKPPHGVLCQWDHTSRLADNPHADTVALAMQSNPVNPPKQQQQLVLSHQVPMPHTWQAPRW